MELSRYHFIYNSLVHLRRFIENNRIIFSSGAGIIFIYLSRPAPESILLGIPIIVIGEVIRTWASGYIKKDTELATSGPYALTRNPLYLGNFFIGTGFTIMANNLWLAIAFFIIFYLIYSVTIKREERKLSVKFGESFAEYKGRVPSFFPKRLKPLFVNKKGSFDWDLVWKHREYNTWLGIAICVLIFIIKGILKG